MADHPALAAGAVAVITGAASGIGRAAAMKLAARGMRVCLADVAAESLEAAVEEIAGLAANGLEDVMHQHCDVGDPVAVARFRDTVYERFGTVNLLMANAGIGPMSRVLEAGTAWHRIIGVNLWGVIHTAQTFVPQMLESSEPGAVVCTGSKQGITCPPGNAAYNVSKSGVKSYTEALAHELRQHEGCAISAHLLVPGFTFTGISTGAGGAKPAAAWTPDQVVDFMIERMAAGDFYILCPDNDVTREMDNKRMAWGMGDLIENRPALSRWHPDWKEIFERYMAS